MNLWVKKYKLIRCLFFVLLANHCFAQQAMRITVKQQDSLLLKHNVIRAAVGASPLNWNDSLAQIAQDWAVKLAESGKLEHNMSNNLGENLYWNSHTFADTNCLTKAVPVTRWASEKANFKGVTFTQDLLKYGHYTQLIWPTTTQVGCGAAYSENGFYVVCNYNPAGNTIGQVIDP